MNHLTINTNFCLKQLCCSLLILIFACQSLAFDDNPIQLILQDHGLKDRIYDVTRDRFIDKAVLLNEIERHQYILLGETHDNIRHHQNQAWVIDNLAKQAFSTSVSFEMIDDMQAGLIANKEIKTADALIALLNHHESGWEYEIYYKGIFERVLHAGFSIYPANIERKKLGDIIRHNKGGLPGEMQQLLSQVSLTPDMKKDLQKEIVESHCGMIDQEMAKPMMQGQRIRDASMALSLLNSNTERKLLIAGSGHVRKDRGVPVYLSSQGRQVDIITVALIEVEQGSDDIADYKSRWQANAFPYDFVWFTERADREDPCLSFKKNN